VAAGVACCLSRYQFQLYPLMISSVTATTVTTKVSRRTCHSSIEPPLSRS
jgi:hypothetical protein